jgi:hypothetical protein
MTSLSQVARGPSSRVTHRCTAVLAGCCLLFSCLSGAAPLSAHAQQTAAVHLASLAHVPRAAPSLGPAPYKRGGWGCAYYEEACNALSTSWLGDITVTPKIVHVGDVLTAHVTLHASPKDTWVGTWEVNDLAPGEAGAMPQVKVIAGCGAKQNSCAWKVTNIAEPGWVVVTVGFDNPIGPAQSQDFYGVVGKGVHVLDGFVRDGGADGGTGMAGVTITIARNQVTYDAVTDGNGFYNALLPAHVWGVFPLTDGLQHPDDVTFSPGSRTVDLATDQTANFTLDPCGKGHGCAAAYNWEMPARYGLRNANGLVDYPSAASDQASGAYQVVPSSWPVTFTILPMDCPKDPSTEQWDWQIEELSHAGEGPLVTDNGPFTAVTGKPCQFTHAFPEEGIYEVKLTTLRQVKAGEYAYAGFDVRQVWVKDWLIVGLGDDFASGAGSADQPGPKPKWEYAACQRSADSFEALVAKKVEDYDTDTSVTFLQLACAGATVWSTKGAVIGGEIPGGTSLSLEQQLDDMKSDIGTRPVDALLVSVGADDIDYWQIVSFCAEKAWAQYDPLQGEPVKPQFSKNCQYEPYPEGSTSDLDDFLHNGLYTTLKDDYARLNGYLRTDGIPADRVFLVEYPDPTTGSDGLSCPMDFSGTVPGSLLHSNFTMPGFTDAESVWLSLYVIEGINDQARIAAENYGWHYVGGVAKGFRGHGYCAPQDQRWITTLEGSIAGEGTMNGVLHPNLAGNGFMADLVSKAVLQDDLYPGGEERSH